MANEGPQKATRILSAAPTPRARMGRTGPAVDEAALWSGIDAPLGMGPWSRRPANRQNETHLDFRQEPVDNKSIP